MKNNKIETLRKAPEPPAQNNAIAIKERNKWKEEANNASQAKVIHKAHVGMFLAIMRIKFAWAIFILIICWLIADMIFILSAGVEKILVCEIYSIFGGVLGMISGIMIGQSCRTKRLLKDIKSEYKLKNEDDYIKYRDRNVQLRIWRGVGNLECVVPLILIGLVCGYIYGRMTHENVEINPPHLEKEVLITLITTTTASVIGILAIVLHWLFPQKKSFKDT